MRDGCQGVIYSMQRRVVVVRVDLVLLDDAYLLVGIVHAVPIRVLRHVVVTAELDLLAVASLELFVHLLCLGVPILGLVWGHVLVGAGSARPSHRREKPALAGGSRRARGPRWPL